VCCRETLDNITELPVAGSGNNMNLGDHIIAPHRSVEMRAPSRIFTMLSSAIAVSRKLYDQRRNEQLLHASVLRLGEISPHLLVDIGVFEVADYPASHRKYHYLEEQDHVHGN
jgi:uncharacterized protein YjiS (DUF1127 family)